MVGLKSLDKIRAKVAEKGSFDGESPFLTLKDGESVVIRFLQELDPDKADERRGQLVVVEEHTGQGPEGYKRRAVCTLEDDGRCWACEQTTLPEIGKKWRPKMRFYANVLVRTELDGKTALAEPKVKILAQGFGDKNVGQLVVSYDEDYESLCGMDLKISRTGKGMNDTSYKLIPTPRGEKPLTEEEEKLEIKDLNKFVKYVPYDSQSDFYAGNLQEEKKDSSEDW